MAWHQLLVAEVVVLFCFVGAALRYARCSCSTLALCNAGQQHALPLWGGTCGIAQVVRQDVGKPIASPASFIDSYI